MDCPATSDDSTAVSEQPAEPLPPSYLLVGPPDLLHDLTLDFADIGWRVATAGWQAVVTAAPADAAAPEPEWPTEVTLAGVRRNGHAAAVAEFLAGPAGGP
jgi:hypothetical protein